MERSLPVVFKDSLETIIAKGAEYLSLPDLDLIRRAYEFTVMSIKRHRLLRLSGEPAIIHPLAVAETLVDWRMDGATVAAGILHDIIEDPKISEFQLHATFKDEVSFLIEGVTKLRKFELKTEADADSAYHHRIFLSSASDIRVAIIKLADRLHNMRTLEFLPAQKQMNNCIETEKIFIPLARFLGMKTVKDEYEDIVLQYMNPTGFEHAVEAFTHTKDREDPFFEEVADHIHGELVKRKIPARLTRWHYNLAHFHDECMNAAPLSDEKLSGFITIVTHRESDCYPAMGVVHALYEHIKGSFDDTIQYPTADLKRWLETRVHQHGTPFKVRVVSDEMHYVNKFGIIPYLSSPSELTRTDFLQERLQEIHDYMNRMQTDGEPSAVEYMTADLFQNEIFVITEKQDRISLPPDSTVLDYAYHLNAETANHFKRAVVNTRPVSIQYRLRSCDKVELITDPDNSPGVKWLSYVRTPFAISCIKKALAGQTKKQAHEAGRNLLTDAVNRIGLVHTGQPDELEFLIQPVAEFLEMKKLNEFFEAIGYGEIRIDDAIEALRSQKKRSAMLSPEQKHPIIPSHPVFEREYPRKVLLLEKPLRGPVVLCGSCTPIPGDRIQVRLSGKRINVHKKGCDSLARRTLPWVKNIDAAWDDVRAKLFPIRLRLKLFHQERTYDILRNIISEKGARFVSMETGPSSGDGLEMLEIILEVADKTMLNAIETAIMSLEDIVVVTRI